ncbi:hypothetical protein BcepSauron_162 [Burkholderia phage BcepSauron]|uniref:Uncharacterized protein n=2 Tax=Sarumanvirus TaxID=2843450 RepID=A0A482MMQ0_9CAUD|nr:hypothetical protein H1O16_gp162 [Burkholderia phage BcepSaruman]YP_009904540.1 hypothetical protein H1O17_gp162 [Burkholderia phage BcepSauron]QBQ74542.1 hypothetical protein BcepSauron_162 [Burkholderia phage BcepSauron]QBX06575.1 hypothetical protein BcepSaruman_162 [Burkholderia phage BcepSaruman]
MSEAQKQPVIAVHLKNGQTVIARYAGENDKQLGLDKPFELHAVPGVGPNGATGVMLTPYLSNHKVFGALDEFPMPHDMVLFVRQCPEDLIASYVTKTTGIKVPTSRIVGA